MAVDYIIPQQTHQPLLAGANSPQQSAFMKLDNMNQKQAAMNNIGGKRKKMGGKRKKMGGANIEVPPTNSSSYNVNANVKQALSSNITSQSNSEYDSYAFKKGGKTLRKRSLRKKSKRYRINRRNTNKKTKHTMRHKTRRYRRHY
jgi:hypothetical protein